MNDILFVGEHSRTYSVQWHTHEQWELVYCTGGQGAFQFDNGLVMNYQGRDAVVIPPGEAHTNVSSGGFTNLYLTMRDPAFDRRGPFRVSDDAEGHLREAFSQARYYFMSDIDQRELMLSALGQLISAYLTVFRANREFSRPVEQIRSAIIRGYTDPAFALDQTMRAMPFHYDYLRKLFKKEMGVTPLEYMTGLRMKKAAALLTAMWNREYAVGEVAAQCGFEDALYFSRVFKKHYGCSPSRYAAEHGGRGARTRPAPGGERVKSVIK